MTKELQKLKEKLEKKKEEIVLKKEIATVEEEIDDLEGKRDIKKDMKKGATILGKGIEKLFKSAGALGRNYEESTKDKKEIK